MSLKLFFSRLTSQKEQSLFQGVGILKKWLDELLLRGVSTIQDDPVKIVEISTRMVDYGLPGIARKLRIIPEKIKETEDWTEYVFMQIGELYLFISSFHDVEKLDELQKEDLLSYAGVVYKKTDFAEDNMLQDEWLYLGCQKEKEEKLIIKRNWFYGIHSHQTILFLEFQFNKFVRLKPLNCGIVYRSAVRFFPSKTHQRIKDLATDQIVKADFSALKTVNLSELLSQYGNAVCLNPFIKHQCYLLRQAKITSLSGLWYFTNDEKQMVVIRNERSAIPIIISYLGQDSGIYVCEYWNNGLTVISVIIGSLVIEI